MCREPINCTRLVDRPTDRPTTSCGTVFSLVIVPYLLLYHLICTKLCLICVVLYWIDQKNPRKNIRRKHNFLISSCACSTVVVVWFVGANNGVVVVAISSPARQRGLRSTGRRRGVYLLLILWILLVGFVPYCGLWKGWSRNRFVAVSVK